jgi:hypothetical protein
VKAVGFFSGVHINFSQGDITLDRGAELRVYKSPDV